MNHNKLDYLNVGCGEKFHNRWVNIDLDPVSRNVLKCNLLKGIPFPDETFEIVYHSQVLEHIPKAKASEFIKDCYRVLRKGGIIRVVVPDLENIVDEYKKFLNQNLKSPNPESEANYDWIMLEMLDQTVRTYRGGEMGKYLRQEKIANEKYIVDRVGDGARVAREMLSAPSKLKRTREALGVAGLLRKVLGHISWRAKNLFISEKRKINNFRQSGEVHMWMYDQYSLARLLKEAGFSNIKVKNAFKSDIPKWDKYELDVKSGLANNPTSLFMEARK